MFKKENDSDSFGVARFVLEEYEKGSLRYKTIYYFADDQKKLFIKWEYSIMVCHNDCTPDF